MQIIFAALLCLTAIIGRAGCDTDTPRKSSISVNYVGKQQVAMSGYACPNHELALRIDKSKRTEQLEWTSTVEGTFEAEFAATDRVPLGNDDFGKGIVFNVTRTGNSGGMIGTFNIAMSDQDPVLNGIVRIRKSQPEFRTPAPPDQIECSITIADIVCDDGTEIPVSVLIRERGPTTKS